VSDYLERFLGVGHDPSPTARFDRLARHLEDYDLCRPELLALFAKLLFLPPDERYLGTGLTPAREREETFRALGQWLRVLRQAAHARGVRRRHQIRARLHPAADGRVGLG